MPKVVTLDTAQMAKLIDVTPQHVRRLCADGVLERARNETGEQLMGRWEMIRCNHAYIHYLRNQGRQWEDTSETTRATLTNRRIAADAEISEIRVMVMKGKLHRTDDVQFYVTNMLVRFKARIQAIPSRTARLLVGCTDIRKIRKTLTDEHDLALRELSVPDAKALHQANEEFLEAQGAGQNLLNELGGGNNGESDDEAEAENNG